MTDAKAWEKLKIRNEYLNTNMECQGESRSEVIRRNVHDSKHCRSVLQFQAMGEEAPSYLGWRRVLGLLGGFLDVSEIDEST